MKKTIQSVMVILCLFISSAVFGQIYVRATSDLHSNKEFDTMDKRVDQCLENANTQEFEIIVEGETRKVTSHDADETCILGAVLPDFEVMDIYKKSINTQSLKGKVNVINFWFTQCKPCLKEMPFLNTLVDQFKDEGVNFVAFNRDDIPTTKNLLTKNEFNFRVIADAEELINKKMKMIWGYPLTIVTDKQNKVVATFKACLDKTCEEELIQTIEKYL